MVKTAKYYDCPNCGIKSRLRRNWVVKNLSYPNGIIHVRGREDIKSVQDAWAYASEVCLYMSKRVLEYPPSDSLDSEMANQLYDHFRTVMPHTNEEIAEFEIIDLSSFMSSMIPFVICLLPIVEKYLLRRYTLPIAYSILTIA
jgi:hypothetical protein